MNQPSALLDSVNLLKAVVPTLEEFLAEIKANNGWLNLPAEFVEIVNKSKLTWWQLYEDEKKLQGLILYFFRDGEAPPAGEKSEVASQVKREITDVVNRLPDIEDELLDDLPSAIEEFKKLTEQEKQKRLKEGLLGIGVMMAGYLNYLSVMVHSFSLTELIQMANAGDTTALCDAIQIDRSIILMPIVSKELMRCQLGENRDFLNKLSARIRNPVFNSTIKYRALYLALWVLESEGLLHLTHEEIFDLLEEAGVYGRKYGIQDVGHLTKRLATYYKIRQRKSIFIPVPRS